MTSVLNVFFVLLLNFHECPVLKTPVLMRPVQVQEENLLPHVAYTHFTNTNSESIHMDSTCKFHEQPANILVLIPGNAGVLRLNC